MLAGELFLLGCWSTSQLQAYRDGMSSSDFLRLLKITTLLLLLLLCLSRSQHFKECIGFIHECRLDGGACLVHWWVMSSVDIIQVYFNHPHPSIPPINKKQNKQITSNFIFSSIWNQISKTLQSIPVTVTECCPVVAVAWQASPAALPWWWLTWWPSHTTAGMSVWRQSRLFAPSSARTTASSSSCRSIRRHGSRR